MAIKLCDYQLEAIENLKTGAILCGGVGSGKSRTALGYYFLKECQGKIKINELGGYSPMKNPKNLIIITTARKRDTFDWEHEADSFLLIKNSVTDELTRNKGVTYIVDSWNNIAKYSAVKDSFFIFDEQRVVGSGTWVKNFLKICKMNNWILLSATPGDTWMDYIPVFVANGFYKNRTEFCTEHVIFSRFAKYSKVDRYVAVSKLIRLRDSIIVQLKDQRKTTSHYKNIVCGYDKTLFKKILVNRWNPWDEEPIATVGEQCYLMRKAVNISPDRLEEICRISQKHNRLIIFYNFNYELELLRKLGEELEIPTTEWNGHKHQEYPKTERWLYLVQYTAGAEAWECTDTDTTVFYSQNYSYKINTQAAGRIDRRNTTYDDLYYYRLLSNSPIDLAIQKALKNKKNFNESQFLNM